MTNGTPDTPTLDPEGAAPVAISLDEVSEIASEVRDLIEAGEEHSAWERISRLHPADIGIIVAGLPGTSRDAMLRVMTPETVAWMLRQMNPVEAGRVGARLLPRADAGAPAAPPAAGARHAAAPAGAHRARARLAPAAARRRDAAGRARAGHGRLAHGGPVPVGGDRRRRRGGTGEPARARRGPPTLHARLRGGRGPPRRPDRDGRPRARRARRDGRGARHPGHRDRDRRDTRRGVSAPPAPLQPHAAPRGGRRTASRRRGRGRVAAERDGRAGHAADAARGERERRGRRRSARGVDPDAVAVAHGEPRHDVPRGGDDRAVRVHAHAGGRARRVPAGGCGAGRHRGDADAHADRAVDRPRRAGRRAGAAAPRARGGARAPARRLARRARRRHRGRVAAEPRTGARARDRDARQHGHRRDGRRGRAARAAAHRRRPRGRLGRDRHDRHRCVRLPALPRHRTGVHRPARVPTRGDSGAQPRGAEQRRDQRGGRAVRPYRCEPTFSGRSYGVYEPSYGSSPPSSFAVSAAHLDGSRSSPASSGPSAA